MSPKQYGVHQGVLIKLMYKITNYGVQTIAYNFISTQRTAGGKHDTFCFWGGLTETLGSLGVICLASVWIWYVIKDRAVGMWIGMIKWERL